MLHLCLQKELAVGGGGHLRRLYFSLIFSILASLTSIKSVLSQLVGSVAMVMSQTEYASLDAKFH